MKKRLIITGLALSLWLAGFSTAWARSNEPPLAFVDLQYRLTRSGFDRDWIAQLFQDKRAEFRPDVVNRIAYQRKEKKADYSHFLKPEVVERGRRFLAARNAILTQAENRFGVAKEVMVAILTVESALGEKTGNYPVFNVFASLAVMDTPEVIERLSLDRRLMGRLQNKANWGRSELQAFLTFCRQNRLDPFAIKGSWAGAFGYSQFLPSSILRAGVDGNQDGRVDLFTFEDAIFSIGNYLQKSGFRLNNRASWPKAVYAYNRSDAYVDTIITLAEWY
ncbi:MAG: lytic murein transglycosylase [Deltaproteobacteria bacterium]|nr:lytic murein transglycosylase [Deltaproteobacteria bacterium]